MTWKQWMWKALAEKNIDLIEYLFTVQVNKNNGKFWVMPVSAGASKVHWNHK